VFCLLLLTHTHTSFRYALLHHVSLSVGLQSCSHATVCRTVTLSFLASTLRSRF
jgi:hypothetical protein